MQLGKEDKECRHIRMYLAAWNLQGKTSGFQQWQVSQRDKNMVFEAKEYLLNVQCIPLKAGGKGTKSEVKVNVKLSRPLPLQKK